MRQEKIKIPTKEVKKLQNGKVKEVKKQDGWLERSTQPVLLQSFNGNMEEAVSFYSAQVDRLYLSNYLLNTQLKASLQQKKDLGDKIFQMQKNQKNSSNEEKKKRHRRCANQISRQFQCKAQKCGKCYGSEGSLAQHMKLKHPELIEVNSYKPQKIELSD